MIERYLNLYLLESEILFVTKKVGGQKSIKKYRSNARGILICMKS
jgi:hypothetical protein